MGSANREMLSDEIGEEHEETADDEAGVDVPLRRPVLALPRLHLAAAHRNFLLLLLPPPPLSALRVADY
jgi:hypothetical protein